MFHRLLAAAAAVVFCLALPNAASAGSRADYICWTGLGGGTDCANLPAGWRIPGVRTPINRSGRVSFTLTRSRIAALSRYIDVENIRPSYEATLYSRRGRAVYRGRRRTAVRGFTRRRRTTAVRGFSRQRVVRRAPAVRSFRRSARRTVTGRRRLAFR